jgi:hypothetical protein
LGETDNLGQQYLSGGEVMTVHEFDDTMRQFVKHQPFFPFVVELNDGAQILIDHPRVAFGGGGAGFISSNDELIDFRCEQVRAIRVAVHESKP